MDRDRLLKITMAVVSVIVLLTITVIIIIQSDLDENLAILEAGNNNIPIIRSEDLDILGRTYTVLNEEFEREIDAITKGNTNRHNLSDNRINPLTHYGVYGGDNEDKFKNDEYINGIRISYDKDEATILDGASNFNDIISVMSIIYDQKMDTIPISELEETFTDLFWMSHTFTYDSEELYPCRYGCSSVNNYRCTDVYNDYMGSNLKYHPFTVMYHDMYEEAGFSDEEDFKIAIPERMCDVHGKSGAGCIWQQNMICYHGSDKVEFKEYDEKKYINIKTKTEGGESETIEFEGPEYAVLGEIVMPEYEDEKFLGPEPVLELSEGDENVQTSGSVVNKDDTICSYYMNIKYCKKREEYSEMISGIMYDIDEIEDLIVKEEEKDEPNETRIANLNEQKIIKENEKNILEYELSNHIYTICEANESASKYWCDGFKLCLGHRTHYKCEGHKVVVCYGHTNINMTVKILYRDRILKKLFDVIE